MLTSGLITVNAEFVQTKVAGESTTLVLASRNFSPSVRAQYQFSNEPSLRSIHFSTHQFAGGLLNLAEYATLTGVFHSVYSLIIKNIGLTQVTIGPAAVSGWDLLLKNDIVLPAGSVFTFASNQPIPLQNTKKYLRVVEECDLEICLLAAWDVIFP